jgi:3-phenylpropionate/cinnamic acid dioxygenase small subunit
MSDTELRDVAFKAARLMAGYAAAIDRADAYSATMYYSEDGLFENGATKAVGRDEIRTWFDNKLDPAIYTQHAVSNLDVQFAESGLVQVDCSVRTLVCSEDGAMIMAGRYRILARDEGACLRIVHKRVRVERRVQLSQVDSRSSTALSRSSNDTPAPAATEPS